MPVLAFPGPAAPAPPPVTLEVPDDWDAVPPGADLLRARGTGAAGDPVEVAVRGTDMEAVIEVRQVHEMADLATATDEQRAAEARLREQLPNQ